MSEQPYHIKYRPKTVKQFYGNKDAKSMLGGWVKSNAVPHCLMFIGSSGCGKTTLARILRNHLDCGDADLREINAASNRGIDTVRKIEREMAMKPIDGSTRVYLIDEAHMLTKEAQNAFLKILEEPPKHAYFFLCTTDPGKLAKTIHTRSSKVQVKPLDGQSMLKLLHKVCMAEDLDDMDEEVLNAIVNVADGSPRQALVSLHQAAHTKPENRLEVVNQANEKKEAIELCRVLMNPKAKWPAVAKVIKELVDIEPEGFRRMMLAYASGVCLGGGRMAPRAFVILDQFQTNYFDSGKAGLIADCWEVVHGRSDE